MDNGIHIRQNEEKSLAMLAAQRQLYSDAKRFFYVDFVLLVIIPFVFSILMLFWKNNHCLEFLSYIVSIIALLSSLIFDWKETSKKELAAYIQTKFDTYVFQMPWKVNTFPEEKDVRLIIDDNSQKLFKKDPNQKERLKNWYDCAENMKTAPLLNTIYSCQHENLTWDYELRKRVRNGGNVLSGVLIFLIIVSGVIFNSSVLQVMYRFVFILPILKWAVDLNKTLPKDMRRLDALRSKFSSDTPDSMDDLQMIEYDFYNHRSQCYLIPDLIYKIYRKRDSEREQRISSL